MERIGSRMIANLATLSAIIPIHVFDDRHGRLPQVISKALHHGVQVILVIDVKNYIEFQEILDKLDLSPHENLSVIFGNYGSPGLARNAGLIKSTGEWICFWDSDDFPFIDSMLSCINLMPPNINVIIGQFENISSNGETFATKKTSSILDLSRDLGIWRIIFRKSRIHGHNFPNLKMAEDKLFFVSLNLSTEDIYFCPDLFYHYSIGSSMSLVSSKTAIMDLEVASNFLKSYIDDSALNLIFAKNVYKRLLVTCIKKGNFKLKIFGFSRIFGMIFQ